MVMVWVPAGEFFMGSKDAMALHDERPVHKKFPSWNPNHYHLRFGNINRHFSNIEVWLAASKNN
jgi:hypothetical protein